MVEAELLFTELFNCDRLSLYLEKRPAITKDKLALISSVLERRITGEPIQYILGKTEFMGLKFKLAPCVFIPRPETEILVETVIKELSALSYKLSALKILDLGTGSGNIAISLAKFLPQAEIYATDISNNALEIAKINARLNNLENRIRFIQGDLFTAYSLQLIAYNLIVSNPPYIPTAEIDNLQPEIQYEPRLALDGGKDGLEFYRKIISLSPYYLKKDGLLIMEIGFNQAGAIRNIFRKSPKVIPKKGTSFGRREGDFLEISGKFEIIEVVKDYNNIDRVIVAREKNSLRTNDKIQFANVK